jgi:hypothetical protein
MTTTTNLSVLTDAQKRAVDEIDRIFEGWSQEEWAAATEVSNANFERLELVRERVDRGCSRGCNDRVNQLAREHNLSDDDEVALSDDAYEYRMQGGCAPLAGDAILAAVAKPWISTADYKALVADWETLFGPVPS